MTRGLLLLLFVAAVFQALSLKLGYGITYEITYGAFAVLAAMISLTFLWLWAQRVTPLALGMGFSWAGAASVMGWWWMYSALSRPQSMDQSSVLFIFLAIYFVGAIQHFSVIVERLGRPPVAIALPIGFALAVSLLVFSVF